MDNINRTSFVLHQDSLSVLEKLTDEQSGRLFKAIHHYQLYHELPELDLLLEIAIAPFINQFKRDHQHWLDKKNQASIAGQASAMKRQQNNPDSTTVNDRQRPSTDSTDSTTVNHSVSISKSVSTNVSIPISTSISSSTVTADAVIEHFNQVCKKDKYKDGAARQDIVKHINRLVKQGETIESLNLLIDYKQANPNTQKHDLYAWFNSDYAGKNLEDAKCWGMLMRPTIAKYYPPGHQPKKSGHNLSIQDYSTENAENILGTEVNVTLSFADDEVAQ